MKAVRRLAAMLAAVGLSVVAMGGTSNASDSIQGFNADEIRKSVVQLKIIREGSIRYPTDGGGENVTAYTITSTSTCTAWSASDTGDFVTAAHCVDPFSPSTKEVVIDYVVNRMVEEEIIGLELAQDQTWRSEILRDWQFEGFGGKGTAPNVTVTVRQPEEADGPVRLKDALARVVDVDDIGDVAIIRVPNVSGTIPLPITTVAPEVGDTVTSIGWPAVVGRVVDPGEPATFTSGTVTSKPSIGGAEVNQVNADLSGGMSGGPTVDAHGNVIGVNSRKVLNDQNFNYATGTSELRSFLLRNGITLLDAPASGAGEVEQPGETGEDEVVPDDGAADVEEEELVVPPVQEAPAEGSTNWWNLALGGLVIVLLAVVAYLVYDRKRNGPQQPNKQRPDPEDTLEL